MGVSLEVPGASPVEKGGTKLLEKLKQIQLATSQVTRQVPPASPNVFIPGRLFDIIKIKMHYSCEIEDFVETHLCKLCVILRSPV